MYTIPGFSIAAFFVFRFFFLLRCRSEIKKIANESKRDTLIKRKGGREMASLPPPAPHDAVSCSVTLQPRPLDMPLPLHLRHAAAGDSGAARFCYVNIKSWFLRNT